MMKFKPLMCSLLHFPEAVDVWKMYLLDISIEEIADKYGVVNLDVVTVLLGKHHVGAREIAENLIDMFGKSLTLAA